MPKRIDHDERRADIADALFRVAAAHGLEAVSVRHVAAEAGVSPGMVQHYFRTKDGIMEFAVAAVGERIQARMAARDRHPETPRGRIRELLLELMPLDPVRRDEARVGVAFTAAATVKPGLAARLGELDAAMRGYTAGEIRAATGAARAESERAAAMLLAMVDGLAIHLLNGFIGAGAARRALDAQLDAAFGVEGG